MIRHLILSVCLVLVAFPAIKAAPIDGIRIESPYRRVVVLVDGQQVCLPTFSCFVANLRGSCRVEVYEAPSRGGILEEENSYMMNVCIAPSMKWKIFSFQRTKDLVETGVLLIITSLADPVTDRQGAGSMNG